MIKYISILIDKLIRVFNRYIRMPYYKSRFGYCGKNVDFRRPNAYSNLHNIYMYDNTNIADGMTFLSVSGTFTMKQNSGSAQNLTVITGNHGRQVGVSFKDGINHRDFDKEEDIIIEEEVWIGANVTLLAGITIGRGVTVGAGSVCTKSIPPYAVVMGNPAKVVGFNFTPEEVIEHEKSLYIESERLPIDLLNKNYEKYFINRLKEIKQYTKL